MEILITKGARKYGYIIWNKSHNEEMEKILAGKESVEVHFNGFNLGEKSIDRKYYRISLGYKLTRAMPKEHDTYSVNLKNNILEVISYDGSNNK
jgi:hypothetical protein